MRARYCFTLLAMLAAFAPCSGQVAARDLSFEDRVKAQEAIERVYYAHQIGATKPFEEAVPRSLLEQKVRTYLKQSVALEKFWKTPVTAEMLRAETERMLRMTRMPDRLREIVAALGNDPFLVQECLARQVLVDRLARNFFAYDAAIHAGPGREAAALRQDLLRGSVDPFAPHPDRAVETLVESAGVEGTGDDMVPSETGSPPGAEIRRALSPEEYARERQRLPACAGEAGNVLEEREAFVIPVLLEEREDELRVARFRVAKVEWDAWWPRVERRMGSLAVPSVAQEGGPMPARLDGGRAGPGDRERISASEEFVPGEAASGCVLDTWENGSLDDHAEPGERPIVWTGSLVIVWTDLFATRGVLTPWRYDPATDTWSRGSTAGAPDGMLSFTAVWTGGEVLVWGRYYTAGGGRYDPVADAWRPMSTTNAPSGRWGHTAVWTGSQMIVWGGYDGLYTNTGGRYDPGTDTWTPTAGSPPYGRIQHTAVWTGKYMVVWGGEGLGVSNTGGRYDPERDFWLVFDGAGAPTARTHHTAVWTGKYMVIWGGGDRTITGGRFDPVSFTWLPTSTVNTPSGRYAHTAVWTGTEMIIWGGDDGYSRGTTGGRYDPVTDTWQPTSTVNAPSERVLHGAVWDGAHMIVWGGNDYYTSLNTGGRYDPASDSWTPTATYDGPSPRQGHTAVWTGTHMVVWGGSAGRPRLNTGGRYDPALDAWSPTSTLGAPTGRAGHAAVWTGTEMVVWGGEHESTEIASGGLYDPVADAWTVVSAAGAPSPRQGHTAVWTGTHVVVWGGSTYDPATGITTYHNTGGRYGPQNDTWAPTSVLDVLLGRSGHTAIWTGDKMIVWGGFTEAGYLSTGSLYDPSRDSWRPVTTEGAPAGRGYHTAVWTGWVMLVWGGNTTYPSSDTGDGAAYDPRGDSWSPISAAGAPSRRAGHTAIWTGHTMIIWGGRANYVYGDGARYDPSGDFWTGLSSSGAAFPRTLHTAVWTGNQMLLWGGVNNALLNSGGRYCGCSGSASPFYQDADGDGYGDPSLSVMSCSPPAGHVSTAGDCDDADGAVHPGAPEICDGLDNDCDAVADNAPVPGGIPFLTAQPSGNDTLLSWSSLSQATGYDVVRGDLSILISSGGDFASATQACLADDLGGTSLSVTDAPATDGGFWYLVRPVNCGGHGSYDSGGPAQVRPRDYGINSSASSCP